MENNQEMKNTSKKRRLIVLFSSLGVVIIFVLLFIFVFRQPKVVEFTNLKTAGNIDPIAIKDGKIHAPANPKVLGWDFVGWCTDTSLEVVIDVENYEFKESTMLYAKWTLHRYVINYNTNGGTIKAEGNPNSPLEYYCSNCNELCENKDQCIECDKLIEEGQLESYEVNSQYAYVIKHDDFSDYTWKYDFDYSTKIPTPLQDHALNGVSLASPYREGYTFEGWFTSPTFEAASKFTDVNLRDFIKLNKTPENITLYAMWAEI